ncbi:hypothetical protein C8R43DRAFT_1131475 [Mycena crocata]|nr:hypothetical protein C8R43DRAFT_1131475 [Mycena crocata]
MRVDSWFNKGTGSNRVYTTPGTAGYAVTLYGTFGSSRSMLDAIVFDACLAQLTLASPLVLRDLATCRPPLCRNHAERGSAGQGAFTLRVGYIRVVDIAFHKQVAAL